MNELESIVRRLADDPFTPGVLATLVAVAGSSYRRVGARLFAVGRDRIGSISGGCLEEDVLTRAENVLKTGRAEVVTYDTTSENDLIWGVGLGCHGVVQVLLEPVPERPAWAAAVSAAWQTRRPLRLAVVWRQAPVERWGTHLLDELPPATSSDGLFLQTLAPPTALVVFGAGDDAQPLVRLAKELGWHVTVADPRPALANPVRFPLADRVVAAPAAELVGSLSLDEQTACVVMTHHYVHDVPILRELLVRQPAYVGLLGPRDRARRILADLESEGVLPTPGVLASLHAPVGLDVGAETPAEVALSVVSEIQAARTGRDGRPLRLRNKPIHE